MTVIAWDGKTLAADKRVEYNCLQRTTTKIFRVRDGLIGLVGNGAHANQMRAWYEAGALPEKFPDAQKNKDDWVTTVIIRVDGIWVYERTPYPTKIEDTIYASGCGRDYALAAMYLGHTSREGVAVASVFDVYCGNGIDELTLEEN